MRHLTLVAILLSLGFIVGCESTIQQTPIDSSSEGTIEEPEEVVTPDTEPAPEVAGIVIPDEVKDLIVIPEGFIIKKFNVVDEDQKRYHIEADVRDNVDNVQNSFIKLYTDKTWENDVNMSQKGNTTTGFNNGEFMIFVDAQKGNLGSIVKIDTGLL